MSRTVTAGLDGSPESVAAAEWAAREAELRGLPLRLVNVLEVVPEVMGHEPFLEAETRQDWGDRFPQDTADGLRARHPGLDVSAERLFGRASEVLTGVARESELLALGSCGLSGIAGFLLGSVGQAVVAHAERPVVLVRAGEQAVDEHGKDPSGIPSAAAPFRPVALGIDTSDPDDTLIGFAFEAAVRRETLLRVVHGWNLPPHFAYGPPMPVEPSAELGQRDAAALTEVLRPWRQKFPVVEVAEESRLGRAADHLVDASREASLLVVGRRIRHAPVGPHIGPVTHAVLHHATAPVAVVPHE
ncbi:universal stress protein [Streptomyces sp. NPDC002845]